MIFISLLLIPLIAVFIDGVAAFRSRNKKFEFGNIYAGNFEVVVPIWGNIKYLENVENLRQYGSAVILCTTGDETAEFYRDLQAIADDTGFRIFRDESRGTTRAQTKRSTSGAIRDRIVRNALRTVVSEKHVVALDADSIINRPISLLVGELARRNLDIASVKLVLSNPEQSLLTRLQNFEYRLAMQMRFITPWQVSGACHVAKTSALRDIMNSHSLFFQGNDVETGILAVEKGYKAGHIPFEVKTEVPSGFKAWWRQRLAWAGGEFRLFIANPQLVVRHPFFWCYGAIIAIAMLPLRWWSVLHPGWPLACTLVAYIGLVLFVHWKTRSWWLLLMPFYCLLQSMVLTPLGVLWYFKMAVQDGNLGFIRSNKKS